MTQVHVPPETTKVVQARQFIDQRFDGLPELKRVAHDALTKLLEGNIVGADVGIRALDSDGARELRHRLALLQLIPQD